MQIMFQIVMTFVFLVDIVLWAILYPASHDPHDPSKHDPSLLYFNSLNEHAINLLLALAEFWLNKITFEARHGAFVGIWTFTYVIFAWFYHAANYGWDWTKSKHEWQYFFLDPTTYAAPFWYAGLGMFVLVVYFGVYKLSAWKFSQFEPRGAALDLGYEDGGDKAYYGNYDDDHDG